MRKLKGIVSLLFAVVILSVFVSCGKNDTEPIVAPDDNEIENPEVNKSDSIFCVETNELIEGEQSLIASNGVVISVAPDTFFSYRVVIDSLELDNKKWNEEKTLVVYCDSNYLPQIVVLRNNILLYQYHERNMVDIIVTDLKGNKLEVVNNLPFDITTRGSTDDVKTFRWYMARAIDCISLYKGIKGEDVAALITPVLHMLHQEPDAKVAAVFIDTVLSIIGAIDPIEKLSLLLNAPDIIRAWGEIIVLSEIGDITPYLISMKRTGKNTVAVSSKIFGKPLNEAFVQVIYEYPLINHSPRLHYSDPVRVEPIDGIFENDMEIESYISEKIAAQLIVYPNKVFGKPLSVLFNDIICYHSNKLQFELAPLYLKDVALKSMQYNSADISKIDITISPKIDYTNSSEAMAYKVSEEEWGLYISPYNQEDKRYKLDKKLSPIIPELSLSVDNFVIDYNNFTIALKEPLTIGTYFTYYKQLRYEKDPLLYQIYYNEKPIVNTGEVSQIKDQSAVIGSHYANLEMWSKPSMRGIRYRVRGENWESRIYTSDKNDYDFLLTDLIPGMEYECQAFVVLRNGSYYYSDQTTVFRTFGSVKDIEFEITPTFKESAPNTENLPYHVDAEWIHPRYLKFWYEVSTDDIQKIQGVSKWGTILYRNGKVYHTYTATKNNWSFNMLRCDEADLTIYNSTYTAVADKASYAIGVFVERTDSLGKTVFETTEPKQIVPTYTQKPEIVISSIENVYDEIRQDDTNVDFHYTLHYRAQGLFWVEPIIGNDSGINLIHHCPLNEAKYTSASGCIYHKNQRPQTIRIMAKDLTTGKIITSNVINIP